MLLYDAFISYSHAKDKAIASALQSVIHSGLGERGGLGSSGDMTCRARQKTPMLKLRHLAFSLLGLLAPSVPLAAYTGHYAPTCNWSTVWMLSGYQYQYICY